MKSANRDLLVLSKRVTADPSELQQEVDQLHEILFHAENIYNFCTVTELIDVNRYKIIRKRSQLEKFFREKKLKPFQFICNKN